MKKIAVLFFLVTFVIGTDTFLISPMLPTLQKAYDIPTEWAGWMVSAYAIGYAAFALIAGPLSDGFDRKRVMICGLIAFAVSTFLCGIAPGFWTMMLFRFFAGISASFVTPQVWASIPILVKPENIIKTMGYATAGLSISQMIGLPIGGYLASLSWHLPFFAISGAALVLMLIIGFALPSISPPKREKKRSFLSVYHNLLKTPRAMKYTGAYFIFQTGMNASFSFIGTWFAKDFSLGVAAIGTTMLGMGLGNAIGSMFGSPLVKKIGEPRSLLLAILLLIILFIGLPFSGNVLIAEVIFFCIFLIGGFGFPVFMSIFQSLTTTARGTVASLANATMYGGTTLGGIVGGILFAHFTGFFGVSLFTAACYLVSLLVYQRSGLFKKTKPSSGGCSLSQQSSSRS